LRAVTIDLSQTWDDISSALKNCISSGIEHEVAPAMC
jgi:hypothetical protein